MKTFLYPYFKFLIYLKVRSNDREKSLNDLLFSIKYPSNHNYLIWKRNIVPSLQLLKRSKKLFRFFPKDIYSFLDIGCCKGFFVFEVSKNHSCKLSVGIDVYEPYISISNCVKEYLDSKNVHFYLAKISDISENISSFGGPFHTVLLINTYHYIFWGSSLFEKGFLDHKEILERLSEICCKWLVFSSPLELKDCPGKIRRITKEKGRQNGLYTTKNFLNSAKRWFKIESESRLGKRPLFLMRKR